MTAEGADTYTVRGPLIELTRARIYELTREPEAVFWVFVFPIVLAAVLGLAFRSKPPEPLPVAVVAGPAANVVTERLKLRTPRRILDRHLGGTDDEQIDIARAVAVAPGGRAEQRRVRGRHLPRRDRASQPIE